MENLFEVLIPLIFAAVYFFGNMFSKEEGSDMPPRDAQRPRQPAEETDEAIEAAERQRRVQEAIRRKIMERRGQMQDQQTQQPRPVVIDDLDAPRRAVQERVKERPAQQREVVEAPHTSAPRAPVPSPTPAVSEDTYELQLEAQLRQIEATKRRAEALRQQAAKAEKKASNGSIRGRSRPISASGFGPVRTTLKNPKAARAAIIYREVLDQPVGLRER